jgi:2,3-dihydroxybiphenyl 1,2-dioxygenase
MHVLGLGYVVIGARQPREWLSFGPEVLGMQLAGIDSTDTVRLRMDEQAYRFLVQPADRDGLLFFGWELPSAEALRDAETELSAAGMAVSCATAEECEARQVQALLRCADPAGYSLELYSGMARAETPFTPGRPISGFRTGDLGLGHLVIGAPDLDRARDFYLERMGFRVSDFYGDRIVFLHCNQRHHSLGLVRAAVGLRHIMLEVNELDDVGTGFDVCQSRGILTRALGRHTNDWMFSFYLMTPASFEIEYGCNGRIVDDATWQVAELTQTSFWGHQHLSDRSTTRLPEAAVR